jgi:hypothetical protein
VTVADDLREPMASPIDKLREIIAIELERQILQSMPEYTVCIENEYGYHYFTHQGRVDAMNYSTAIFLINDEVRALYIKYVNRGGGQTYMAKTFDKTINKDDYVVIPTTIKEEDNMTVAKVVEVDAEIDFDSTTIIPWVISKIDLDEFTKITELEKEAIKTIREAHFAKRKKTLAADLMEAKELMKLPLAKKAERPEGEEVKTNLVDHRDTSW